MVLIQWKFRRRFLPHLPSLREWLLFKYGQAVLTYRSLTYNDLMDRNYFIDICLQPIFWFVERFAKYLGKVFVFCVVVLTAAVVAMSYWIGVPYWYERNPTMLVFLVIFGNWILLNLSFHYWMAIVKGPGYPPHGALLVEVASICKKCLAPKPPRTHHCSICDRCVLAMDHHCPWINNCVGYQNVRYFYLYMLYTLAGIVFIIIAGFDIGYVVIWLDDTGGIERNFGDPDLVGHPVRLNKSGYFVPIKNIAEYDSDFEPREHELPVPPITGANKIAAHFWKKKAVILMAVICISVSVGLGSLIIMHGKNINKGQTCIEAYINLGLKKKIKRYRNPYDFGRKKNWKLMLGLTQGRSFVRHVLFPSTHDPVGNGLTFHTIHNGFEDWP